MKLTSEKAKWGVSFLNNLDRTRAWTDARSLPAASSGASCATPASIISPHFKDSTLRGCDRLINTYRRPSFAPIPPVVATGFLQARPQAYSRSRQTLGSCRPRSAPSLVASYSPLQQQASLSNARAKDPSQLSTAHAPRAVTHPSISRTSPPPARISRQRRLIQRCCATGPNRPLRPFMPGSGM